MQFRPSSLIALLAAIAALQGHAQTIKAVTEESSYTFVRDGKVAGPATEIVEAALKRAGLNNHKITLYPWARAYDMALQEPNTLIYLIARTPAREAQFKWAGEFLRIEYHLYKLRSRKDVVVRNLPDAKAYAVGVMRDDVRQQYLQSRGFDKLVVSARNSDSLRMLVDGRVQLLPLPDTDMLRFCREANIDPSSLEKVLTLHEMTTGIYMAYSRGTPDETVARTRQAFDQLKADGTVARLMASASNAP
ncbi:MAG: substrate-binding periplasmic protein [Pseudomonadota bacterium]